MAMAAARRAGGLEWLSGAAEDYGQTPTFTFPALLKECELNAAAGLVIDIETTRPRLLKLIDDFEKEACSQHEAKDPSWSTELSGALAGRRTELPFFRHALETDPWRDIELEIHNLREAPAAAQAAAVGGGGGAAPAVPAPAPPRRRQPRRGAPADQGDQLQDADADAVDAPAGDAAADEAAARRAQIEDLEILLARQHSRYAILVKYVRTICSDRMQVLLRSRIRREYPDMFVTGTREHWTFITAVLVESCSPVDFFSATSELLTQLSRCTGVITVIDKLATFQQVYDNVLPQVVIASTLRYQGFGADVMRVLATTTDIAWDEERTLPQWAGILDVLDQRVLASLDYALLSRSSHNTSGQRHTPKHLAPRYPTVVTGAREACRNFASGRCVLGDQCPRSHSASASAELCRNFAAGRCLLGNQCPRSHASPTGGGSGGGAAARTQPAFLPSSSTRPNGQAGFTSSQRASASGSAPASSRSSSNPASAGRQSSNAAATHASQRSSSFQGRGACHRCHKGGHHSRDCRGGQCSCGRTGAPAPGCPHYVAVHTVLLGTADPDNDRVVPSTIEVGSATMPVFPSASPRVGTSALLVRARFHIAGGSDLIDYPVMLDTGSNCNIMALSVAHNVSATDPVAVQSLNSSTGGGLTTLRDAATAYVQYYEGGSVGLKAVHGYVIPDSHMPAGSALLLGLHSINDLDVDLRRCMKDGAAGGLHQSLHAFPGAAQHFEDEAMPDLVLDSDDDSSEDDPEGYDAEDDAMPVLFPDDDDDDATPDLLSDSDDDDDDYYDCWRPATNTANQGAAAPRLAAVDSPGFRPGRLFTTRHGVQQRLFDVHTTAALADVRAPRRWSTSTGLDTWGVGPERSPAPASTSCFWSEVSSQAYLDTSPTLSGRWSHLDINISADIPAALAQRIRGWALRNANIFATTEFPPASKQFSEIVGAHDMNAELLDGCRPFHAGARSYKPKESEILKLWTRRNLEEGILVPNPTSPWASHIHLVSKQDSVKPRVVVDMRQVNERIRPRPGAMPDGIAELQRASTAARFRLSADALVCYGQFEVTPSSYDINTIHTPLGKMAYTRLTMGYQPASRVQQTYYTAAMDSLPPAVRPNVANFADDFNTWANDDDSFMERLDAFATMCTTYGIYLSPAKTSITGPSTDSRFYGFTLRSYDSGGGSTITTDSVGALQNMEMPTSTAEVRQILGLLNFSRLLVPHYASLVFPCTQLLKKDAFSPGTPFSLPSEAEAALRGVVQILTSSATRYSMDPRLPLHADVDSSTYGWGCHLFQNIQRGSSIVPQSIAWLSKQWPPALRSRPSFMLECHGLFSALKAIRPWANSNEQPVLVRTDARSILWAHKQSTGPVAGYAAEAAAETPHSISWLPGSTNAVPDALSRPPLVGPRVLATHGLGELLSLLLTHAASSLVGINSVWLNARHDTDAMVAILRRHVHAGCSISKKAPSDDHIASDTSGLAIIAPEPWRAPSVVRQLLAAGRAFAVLVPHDIIPETARNDDGSYNSSTAAAMATAVFVGSASSMFTWVVHLPHAAALTHLLTMALEASTGVGGSPSSTTDPLDVASWIGKQHGTLPPRDGGTIVSRPDGLQLYVGTDGIMRVVVPAHLRRHIADITHLELQHLKDKYVLQRLRRHFWFPAMHEVVRTAVLECPDCNLTNANRLLQHGDYHAPWAPAPRTRWQVDTKSFGGGRHCMACVDVFSGYIVLIPLRAGRSLLACTKAFIDNVVLVFGVPYSVRVDMSGSFGPGFTLALRRFGIEVTGTGAEHPTGNSAVERAWPLVTKHFMIPGNADDDKFESGLRLVAWAHNIAVRPYGFSAHEAMFASPAMSSADRFAFTAADTTTGDTSAASVLAIINTHDITLDNVAVTGRLIRDSTVARMNARARGSARTFAVNDLVVVYRDPSGSTSDQYGRQRDYIPRWLGPGPVVAVRGHGMYDVSIGGSIMTRSVSNILPWRGPAPDPSQRTCSATSKRSGGACTNTARSNGFCGRHQAHAGTSGAASARGSGNQCTATAANTGARCTARAKHGDKCGRHRSSSSTDVALAPSGSI